MDSKKPQSKTIVLIIIILLLLGGFGLYYTLAIRNSDNRPKNVETESIILVPLVSGVILR